MHIWHNETNCSHLMEVRVASSSLLTVLFSFFLRPEVSVSAVFSARKRAVAPTFFFGFCSSSASASAGRLSNRRKFILRKTQIKYQKCPLTCWWGFGEDCLSLGFQILERNISSRPLIKMPKIYKNIVKKYRITALHCIALIN